MKNKIKNFRTLCREVVLSKDLNVPLLIDGKSMANVQLKSSNNELLVYQLAIVPKDKFDINLIKMTPYCIVNDRK